MAAGGKVLPKWSGDSSNVDPDYARFQRRARKDLGKELREKLFSPYGPGTSESQVYQLQLQSTYRANLDLLTRQTLAERNRYGGPILQLFAEILRLAIYVPALPEFSDTGGRSEALFIEHLLGNGQVHSPAAIKSIYVITDYYENRNGFDSSSAGPLLHELLSRRKILCSVLPNVLEWIDKNRT
jgi:hypothetical protein